MKKAFMLFAILSLVGFSQPITISKSSIENMGWFSPTGSDLTTDKAYNFKSLIYLSNFGRWHSGDDYKALLGSDIYSVSDGIVYIVKPSGSESYVIVKSDSEIGIVYFIYGHVEASVTQGSSISAGQRLGKVLRYGSPDHLHFGIQKNTLNLIHGWGRTPSNIDPLSIGFISPTDFLTKTSSGKLRVASSVLATPVLLEQGGSNKIIANLKNSSSTTFSGSVAVAIHKSDGTFVADFQVVNVTLSPGATKSYTFSNPLSNIMPGLYKLVLKEKSSGGSWIKIAPNGYTIPDVTLTLRLASTIKIVGTVYTNSTLQATYSLKNFANQTFRGDMVLALHSSSGAFIEDIMVLFNQSVSSGQTKTFAFSKKLTRPAGIYKLYAKLRPQGSSNWIQIGSGSFSNPVTMQIMQRPNMESGDDVPNEYVLSQNYPNPFNPSTRISVSVPKDGFYELSVFSITGELVSKLVAGQLTAGVHTLDFNASNLPSGIYIYRLAGNDVSITRKMTLMK